MNIAEFNIRYKVVIFIYLLLFISLDTGELKAEEKQQKGEEIIKKMSEKYINMMRIIVDNYVDSVDVEKITEQGFKAMLQSLDNQSVYLDKDFYKSNKEIHTGRHVGLGTTVVKYKDTVLIHYITPTSPAALNGLKNGDRIYKIDTTKVKHLSEYDIDVLLKGEENSQIRIGYFRKVNYKQKDTLPSVNDSLFYVNNGFEYKEVKIKRATYLETSVNSFYQKDGYTYIKLGRFTNVCDRDFLDSLKKMDKKKTKFLIIDVRGNGGGYLDQVVGICGAFLDSGDYVIKSKATNPNYNVKRQVSKKGEYFGLPLKILIDGSSASGSEILAGVVQDYDLGTVYGERSYGKGTVQNTWNFNDETGFKITVAEYLTPLERPIDKQKNKKIQIDNSAKLELSGDDYKKLEEEINKFGLGNVPIYRSRGGKFLLGGGGIVPDIAVPEDTTTILTQAFTTRRILFDFVHQVCTYKYYDIERCKDIDDFEKNFVITDKILTDFKVLSFTYNTWNEEMFAIDKEYIRTLLKARIAEVLFGQENYYRIINTFDKTVQTAIH